MTPFSIRAACPAQYWTRAKIKMDANPVIHILIDYRKALFLALGGEALTDLDTGAAAVEILSTVGVSGIKRGVFQGRFWFRKIPYGLLFGRRVEDGAETGTQVDGFTGRWVQRVRIQKSSSRDPSFFLKRLYWKARKKNFGNRYRNSFLW